MSRPFSNDGPPYLHLAAQAGALAAFADQHRCALVHGPVNFGPLVGRTPSVVTVLDLMWWTHPHLTGFGRIGRLAWGGFTFAAARRANRVIAISETVARDVERYLGVDRRRIDVTLLGGSSASSVAPVEPDEIDRALGLGDKRVILCVAQKQPHKNHSTILHALGSLPEDVVLVAPGADDGFGSELMQLASRLGVADRVRLLEWVDEALLEGLYRRAAVVAQVSLMEGFGLPALEAMQRGVPTVVSDTPALAEVAGGAALVVPAQDGRALAAAISRVIDDPTEAARLRVQGLARARALTWDATAAHTVATYERALVRTVS